MFIYPGVTYHIVIPIFQIVEAERLSSRTTDTNKWQKDVGVSPRTTCVEHVGTIPFDGCYQQLHPFAQFHV